MTHDILGEVVGGVEGSKRLRLFETPQSLDPGWSGPLSGYSGTILPAPLPLSPSIGNATDLIKLFFTGLLLASAILSLHTLYCPFSIRALQAPQLT